MKIFPSNKIMWSIILVLTLLYGWKFINEAKKDFFQLNYDWKKEEIKKDFGEVFLDSVSHDYVRLRGIKSEPNNQKTYKLSRQNTKYYFRFVYISVENSGIQLSGIEWITDIPEISQTHYQLEEVSLPLKQTSGPSVLTFGDEQLIKNEAKYYKKDLLKMYPVNFKGDFRDIYNFPHQTKNGNTVKDLLQESQTIASVDFYILFFGLHENSDEISLFKEDVNKLLTNLLNKNPEKIILFTLLPSRDKQMDEQHKKLNGAFLNLAQKDGVELIDTYKIFSHNPEKFIREDNSISRDGYFELAKASAKILKNAN